MLSEEVKGRSEQSASKTNIMHLLEDDTKLKCTVTGSLMTKRVPDVANSNTVRFFVSNCVHSVSEVTSSKSTDEVHDGSLIEGSASDCGTKTIPIELSHSNLDIQEIAYY